MAELPADDPRASSPAALPSPHTRAYSLKAATKALRWVRKLSVRLVVIALVPAVGLAGFASDVTLGHRDAAEDTLRIQADADELSEVVALRYQIASSELPMLAVSYGPRLGLAPAQMTEILGFDLEQALDEAMGTVRTLVASRPADVDFVWAGQQMTELEQLVRSGQEGTDIVRRYIEILTRLDERADRIARKIVAALDGESIVSGLRLAVNQLVAAHQLARWGGHQLMAFFNAELPGMGFSQETLLDLLPASTAVYQTAAAEFDDIVIRTTRDAWQAFNADPDVVEFNAAIDRSLAGTSEPLLADLDRTAALVRSGLGRQDAYVELIRSGIADVTTAATTLRSEALERLADAVALLLVVGLVSLVLVYFVARSVARPLRQLARYAAEVSAGDVHAPRPSGGHGPTEVRTVSAAFDEVVDNLRAIDAHALALAAGRLDAPVLQRPLPGQLGQSLQASVAQLSQSIADREDLQRRLVHEATHDGLTGVANRATAMYSLESALARNRRRGTALAVLLVDVDDFKRTNEAFGQAMADEVLREISRRLRDLARTDDTVARLGGDEFLLIAEAVGSIHDAVAIAERIVESLGLPMSVAGRPLRISASVGVAMFVDGHTDGDTLVREADLAVYRAKEFGPGRVEVFDTTMRDEVSQRSTMEERLASALRRDELTVAYQPVVSTAGLFVRGFEALVRWKDADGRSIPPDSFIPIAESSDLIIELDRWVIRRATAELATWSDRGLGDDLHVAVNVSGRHLVDRRIVSDVADALRESGLCPTRLVLEITETVLLSDMPVACAHLDQLRALGVTIALDDFGSGYTSLATLRQLPVDILKIDRSLVAELGPDRGQSLVRLIIEAAHEFGMGVVAEGVETDEQRSILEALGCEQVQGWLVSPAVPAVEARTLAQTLAG